MIYLASPYTHADPKVRHQRFLDTQAFVANRLNDFPIFSPIVYSVTICEHSFLPDTFEFWQPFNDEMMHRCDKLWVYMLDGWEQSRGVKHELYLWVSEWKRGRVTYIAQR